MIREITELQWETEEGESKKEPPKFSSRDDQLKPKLKPALIGLLIIGVGVYSGFLLASRRDKASQDFGESGIPKIITRGEIVGSTDAVSFRDSAVGILEKNEDGPYTEGTHKLIREGGPSQTAYLVSSIVDLDQFVGRKIEVWGETFHSEKVGWFMDVGRLKVLK